MAGTQNRKRAVEDLARGAALHPSCARGGEEADALVDHTEINQLVSFGVADNPKRFEPLLDALDLLAQKFSELDHSLVADTEVFSGAVGE